jgi:hypothetical protein
VPSCRLRLLLTCKRLYGVVHNSAELWTNIKLSLYQSYRFCGFDHAVNRGELLALAPFLAKGPAGSKRVKRLALTLDLEGKNPNTQPGEVEEADYCDERVFDDACIQVQCMMPAPPGPCCLCRYVPSRQAFDG